MTGDLRPTVVLLHGAYLSRRMWEPQVPALEAVGLNVLWPDLRWHGVSTVSSASFSVDACTADVLGLLCNASAECALVCGYGFGGMVALKLALMAPYRVRGLVLVDATYGMASTPSDAFSMSFANAFLRFSTIAWQSGLFAQALTCNSPAQRDYVSGELARHARDGVRYRAIWKAMTTFNCRSQLMNIACPTLLVSAAGAESTSRQANIIARVMTAAQQVSLPDCGYLMNMDNPREFNKAMISFVQSICNPLGG